MKKHELRHRLAFQAAALVVLAGLLCGLLFAGLHGAVRYGLDCYFTATDYQKQATERRIQDFQDYVSRHHLHVTDRDAISHWARQQPLTLMEIYQSNVLVYTSYAPENEDVAENELEVPYYDWFSYYIIQFEDGSAEVLLYCDDAYRIYTWATIAEVLVCALVFVGIFLLGCRRPVRYLRRLSRQVEAMESGDLDTPIGLEGSNELATLAQGLDAMRLALRAQQQQAAQTYEANQALISQMSHDLRTPLTSLLLYSQILRLGKYDGPAQLQMYLDKIERKAQQIQQLAQNILTYSLHPAQPPEALDEPAPAAALFGPLLEEAAAQLGQHGYVCQLDLHWGDGLVQVNRAALGRIVDNLVSNLLKYADPAQPVRMHFTQQAQAAVLTVENAIASPAPRRESTCIGLASIHTLIGQMHGSCQVQQTRTTFTIRLQFPQAGAAASPREERRLE